MCDGSRNKVALSFAFKVCFLFFLFFCLTLNAEETPSSREKKVLVIHSYHHTLAWTEGQDEGIRKVLDPRSDIDISTEYLDTKRFDQQRMSNLYADFLAEKYQTKKFDIVIVTDNNALKFVSDYYEKLFAGIPVVFSGINNFKPSMLKNFHGLATGVVQVLEPKGTYNLIRQLQGPPENLVVVSGATPTAKAIKEEVKSALAGLKSQKIIFLDALETADLLRKLSALSQNDAVILCNFNRDGKGRYYSHQQSGRMISQASRAPVYAMEDHYLDTGIVGGFMNSSLDQGLVAGKKCLSILQTGTTFEVVTSSPNVIMFDYKPAARFGLDLTKLPLSAVVINKPVSFYQQNKTLIWNTIIIFCLLLLALLGISIGFIRARSAESKLRISQQRLKFALAVNNDGIFDWNVPENKIYLSPRYYTMAGYEPDEFPGTYENWINRLHPDEVAAIEKVLEDYFAGKIPFYDREFRFKRKDGTWMWIRARIKVVEVDKAGKPRRVVGTHTDITNRKQAELALQESESKLKTVFNNSYELMGILTVDGLVLETNRASLEFNAFEESDVIGKPFWETPWWEKTQHQQDQLREMISKAANGKFIRQEVRHINLKGEIHYIDFSIAPVKDDQGKIIYLVPEGRDITKRKLAEEALRLSEKKYRTLFEQSADAILIIQHGRFVDCNQATLDMLGVPDKKNLLNTHPADLSPETQSDGRDSREKASEMMDLAVEQGSHRFEWDHKRNNGKVFPVEVLLTSVNLDDESFIHVVWRDITERKLAEQERERNRYYLQRAQQIGQIGTWELDILTNKLIWTEENYHIFGIPLSTELNYDIFYNCIHPDDRKYVDDMWQKSITSNVMYDIEHRIIVDGKVKWVREKAELEINKNGKCIRAIGFTQDITVRKRAEKQREQLLKSLEYKNRELQDIVYTASHDLRSPLVNIEGFSSELETACTQLQNLLSEKSEDPDKDQKIETLLAEDIPQCLKFIVSGAKKMSSLLDGLLQISRIGTVQIKRQTLDMNSIVKSVLESMHHQVKKGDIEIIVDPMPACIGDANMVDRVFTNLISNAIKYRDPAKKCKIKITGNIEERMSVYCVQDNGLGIAPEHQKKVFEIFHRLNPEGPVRGEGLGLTIVTRILDRLGGKIWLESEPGKGSKFCFTLSTA